MTGAPGNVKGSRREPSDPASESPRNAGASFRRWLGAVIPDAVAAAGAKTAVAAAQPSPDPVGQAAVVPAPLPRPADPALPAKPSATPDRDIAALCDRFESITAHLERLVHNALELSDETPAAATPPVRRPSGRGDRTLDSVVAEIAARQRALAEVGSSAEPSMFAPVLRTPAPTPPDLSGLEQQLKAITLQLETLRSPCRAEELVADLRHELREIGRAVHDLVPRNAFDALEREVRTLTDRLDESRRDGRDAAVLAPIEAGLAEVRDALRGLAPTELAGSVNTLFHKIEQVSAEGFDPTVVQQLREAIETLRGVVGQVASGDALAALVNEVRTLSDKIERPAPAEPVAPDLIAGLERQISGIAEALASQAARPAEPPPAPGPALEPLMASLADKLERFDLMTGERNLAPIEAHISALGDKIDRLQSPHGDDGALRPLENRISDLGDKIERIAVGTDPGALVQIEDRIKALADKLERLEGFSREHPDIGPLEGRLAQLVQKIESSESRLDMLPALERGMADLLAHVEALHKERNEPAAFEPKLEAIARDVEGIRQSQAESERRTRQSLEATQGTIGQVVDRLSTIENELRNGTRPATPPAPEPRAPAEPAPSRPSGLAIPIGPPPRPDSLRAEATRSEAVRSETASNPPVSSPPAPPRMGEAGLAPDAPIEPGSGPPWFRGGRSAADRIAASQAALGPSAPDGPAAPESRPNFILAARRAAQAASEQQTQTQAAAGSPAADVPQGETISRRLSDRVKALFVGTSMVVIMLALVPIGLRSIDFAGNNRPDRPAAMASVPASEPTAVASGGPTDLVPSSDLATAARSLAAASPSAKALIERHIGRLGKDESSLLAPPARVETVPAAPPASAPARTAAAPAAPSAPAADITGSLPPSRAAGLPAATPLPPTSPAVPPASATQAGTDAPWSDTLPPALSTKPLLAGVATRNPAAAYEIAMRYAEGRGVPADMAAAAVWFGRAAERGLAPAQFRLGSLYEKGQGVRKDLGEARRLYLAAAERGNANAMHNLAVLYAEGIDGKPDFATAAQWFTKAARYGIADSQYNLAILHARGIGVEQNLGEAYKWFAVAAQKGDGDAARKRDELAQRLDQQTLTAARLAAQTFVPLSSPDDAVTVQAPPGGWEDATIGTGKPKTRRVPLEQAARL